MVTTRLNEADRSIGELRASNESMYVESQNQRQFQYRQLEALSGSVARDLLIVEGYVSGNASSLLENMESLLNVSNAMRLESEHNLEERLESSTRDLWENLTLSASEILRLKLTSEELEQRLVSHEMRTRMSLESTLGNISELSTAITSSAAVQAQSQKDSLASLNVSLLSELESVQTRLDAVSLVSQQSTERLEHTQESMNGTLERAMSTGFMNTARLEDLETEVKEVSTYFQSMNASERFQTLEDGQVELGAAFAASDEELKRHAEHLIANVSHDMQHLEGVLTANLRNASESIAAMARNIDEEYVALASADLALNRRAVASEEVQKAE